MSFRKTLVFLAAIALVGCNETGGTATAAAPVKVVTMDEGLPDPVATIGGETISLAELEKEAAPQIIQARMKLFDARNNALQSMIDDRLVDAEAKKRGVTRDDLLKAEIDAKITPPTDADIAKFYEENKGRMRGAPLEEMKPKIIDFMTNNAKKEKHAAYIGELRKAAGVQVHLAPPRFEVGPGVGARKGSETAPVQIIEFSDFQCPYCTKASKTVDEIVANYGDNVSVVYRHFPLPIHKQAARGAEASECAKDQGRFWEYHDILFANQRAMSDDDLANYAGQAGLDVDKFKACLTSGEKAKIVEQDIADGKAVGMSGTPGFYINGRMISGARDIAVFTEIIDAELAAKGVATADAQGS